MYYFFKTVNVKKKEIKVLPIDNQKLSSGELIDSKKYVSCSKDTRYKYPVGTIFYSTYLSSSKSYYTTDKTFQILKTSDVDAYSDYVKLVGVKEAESFVKKEVSVFESIALDKELTAPTSKEDGFYVTEDDWRLLVRNIKEHVNTMIIGPTGTGKTSICKKVCDKMGKKLYIFDMGSMIDPISSLLGVHRLVKGGSVFDYAKFTQVIQEPCVILFDELSRASLAAMNILFPCLDDRRVLNVEIASGDGLREIKINPEVTFLATANIGSEYTGTNSMDRALINRFFPLELGLIPSKEEIQVLIKRTDIKPDSAELVVKIANNIRNLVSKQDISVNLSIRETLMVANLIKDGWSIGKAMEIVYLPLYEGTKSEGERSTVYKTISSY